MSILSAVLLALAVPGEPELETFATPAATATIARGVDSWTTITFYGRGTWIRGGDGIDGGPEWSELFEFAAGGGVEWSFLSGAPDEQYGYYVSFTGDIFQGDTTALDSTTDIEPDDMFVGGVLIGMKAASLMPSGFVWEGRIGVGAAAFDDVDATTIDGSVETDIELYKRSIAFVGEASVRAGFASSTFAFLLGLSGRYLGPPEEGDDALGADPEGMLSVSFEAALILKF